MKIWQLIVVGIAIHVTLFYSIFDIYFTSPLVHGATPISPPLPAPSKRLVLFVADGLRADKFFELRDHGKSWSPFLRNIVESEGVWGVSHTRVPTESRPGHVAIIAGFYEDVSAVAKGWKENPVEFDSVFNESRHTWSWGSPDILPMFAKGASGDHVSTNCYDAEFEDFARHDKNRLDTWVFDKVKQFFKGVKRDSSLDKDLREDKNVFFLHLLGIDTHGHSNKPHSWSYLNNIKVVDKGIKEVVDLVEQFYNHDGKTSYIMTADHGMTDWGSHGAGHNQETFTPFVAWGAGVRKPVTTQSCGDYKDDLCDKWKLESVKRTDIEQAALAPLMSYLAGIPYPVNSVGVLPIDVLSVSDAIKSEALLSNAEQLLAQFQMKMDQTKARTISATFRPFKELTEDKKILSLKHIKHLIHNGQFQEAIKETHILIDQALRGLQYYQTYDRLFLGVSIVLGFLGWMSCILVIVLSEDTDPSETARQTLSQKSVGPTEYFFLGLGICIAFLLYVQSLPWTCYLYCLLPVPLWYRSFQGFDVITSSLLQMSSDRRLLNLLLSLVFCGAGLEIMVQSFYHRELLSLVLLVLSAWPFVGGYHKLRNGMMVSCGWTMSCCLLAIFPLLPVIGKERRYWLVFSSGIIVLILGSVIARRISKSFLSFQKIILTSQVLLVGASTLTVYFTSDSIERGKGLPRFCQITSWSMLGLSVVLPLLSPTNLPSRLFSLSLSFFSVYILLSITYESCFVLVMFLLLYFWLRIEELSCEKSPFQVFQQLDFEQNEHRVTSRHVRLADLRRAFFFLFLLVVAFFGTGNIASVNSFNPSSVLCFLTVFSPFSMGALMMLKILIPILLVTIAFRGVHVLAGTPLRSLFLIVLIMSDFMGLNFFFLVRDYGSWLDIGTTISHYVIVMVLIIFLMFFMGISHGLMSFRLGFQHKIRPRFYCGRDDLSRKSFDKGL